MSFIIGFIFGEMIISSAFQGQVLLNQKPLQNVIVKRECKWTWSSETIKEQQLTDQNGHFKFNEVIRRSFLGNWLPHEPVLPVDIIIEHNGVIFKAFLADKRSYKRYSEFQDKRPKKLICDLGKKVESHENYYGLCELVDL